MDMSITAVLSLLPTILLKTPTLLSYLSMVGTFATVALAAAVLNAALAEGDLTEEIATKLKHDGAIELSEPYHAAWNSSGLSPALGVVAYCFSGHAIVPSIYTHNMKEPRQFEFMVTVIFVGVFACCLAVAVSGYYMFGELVEDQVTVSLEQNSKAAAAMTGLAWLMIMTAFSKITFTMSPLALGLEEIVAPCLSSDWTVEVASSTIKL